jgi:hypothetical protein
VADLAGVWQLPVDWREAIADPPADALLDPAALAAEVFFGEHVMLYGLPRALELQPEVDAAIARARPNLRERIARILDGTPQGIPVEGDGPPATLDTGRWRYNQHTKTWEAR